MPANTPKLLRLTPAQTQQYDRDGYLLLPGFLSQEEVRAIADVFDRIGAEGKAIENYWTPDLSADAKDQPLARYPRVMMPHRFDDLSRRVLLDSRMHDVLMDLMGQEPIGAQTMFYYKPPGAKGQAFHQDNFYLEVKPGTCMAAWIAIDPSTTENGGLWVVPGSHKLDIICPDTADGNASFTRELVKPPPGMTAVPANLAPGDTMFFNGSLIHGSQGNHSPTTWRRSFICHYVPQDTAAASGWFRPFLAFDGKEVPIEKSTGGGPCGSEHKPSSYATVP